MMNQEERIRTEFPFELFHLTKSYDDILSDNEYLGRIRNLLSDITDINQVLDLSYGSIFESAYLICGLLTHPAYIHASFDEEFISYDMLEKLEDSLSIHKRYIPFVRCVTYLLLSRMDNPIRGTAYIVDELERKLKRGIHIIERPWVFDRNRTREYHFNFAGLLKEFNKEYTKKYHFDFGVQPLPSTLWNVEDIGFLMDISIIPRKITIDFIYRFVSYWPSLPERIKILNKIQAHFLNKYYLEAYDEDEKNEVVEIVHCVMDETLDRLKNEEECKKDKVKQLKNELNSHPHSVIIQKVDTFNYNHYTSPSVGSPLTVSDGKMRNVLEQLVNATDDVGNNLFTDQGQWYAVYRVLSEQCDYPKNMTDFCRVMSDMGMEEVNPPCKYSSVKKVASSVTKQLTSKTPLWKSHLTTADSKTKKQIEIALKLLDLLTTKE